VGVQPAGTPSDTPEPSVSLPTVYAYETSQQIIPFTNPGPSSITITGFASRVARGLRKWPA